MRLAAAAAAAIDNLPSGLGKPARREPRGSQASPGKRQQRRRRQAKSAADRGPVARERKPSSRRSPSFVLGGARVDRRQDGRASEREQSESAQSSSCMSRQYFNLIAARRPTQPPLADECLAAAAALWRLSAWQVPPKRTDSPASGARQRRTNQRVTINGALRPRLSGARGLHEYTLNHILCARSAPRPLEFGSAL